MQIPCPSLVHWQIKPRVGRGHTCRRARGAVQVKAERTIKKRRGLRDEDLLCRGFPDLCLHHVRGPGRPNVMIGA